MEEQPSQAAPADSPWRVLVLDDDPDIQVLTAAVLDGQSFEGRGIELIPAHSAAEGLERLRQHPDIAAALVDVAMETDTAGLEFVRAVRQDLNNSLLRVILRTARQDQAPAREAVTRYEIDAYDSKSSLDQDYLFATLAAALRTHRIMLAMTRQREELERTLRERDALEIQLRRMQKLEAVGQLGAGIAHEINTPVQFVSDNCHYIQGGIKDLLSLLDTQSGLLEQLAGEAPGGDAARNTWQQACRQAELPFLAAELPQAIARSLDGLGRIGDIVRAMREFSHPGGAGMAPADLNQAVRNTLVVAGGELRPVAEVSTELAELPPVPCHVAEINQALLNILVNAAHAIGAAGHGRGRIRLRSWVEDDQACLSVADDGIGIAPEIRERIFEPFFTTKAVGQGSGQGLAIAHDVIVRRHGGQLDVADGDPGTVFTLRLPLSGPPEKAPDRVQSA